MMMTVKDDLIAAGYNLKIFRNQGYPIENVKEADEKIKKIKDKYPMYVEFEKCPNFGPSEWSDCKNGLPKDKEGFVQVFIKTSWDKAKYQKTLGSEHPKCFATEENVIKFYLKENTDYFDEAIDAAKLKNEPEAVTIAQLSKGRAYAIAAKRIIALNNKVRLNLCYKAVAAVAIIGLMVFSITNRYAH